MNHGSQSYPNWPWDFEQPPRPGPKLKPSSKAQSSTPGPLSSQSLLSFGAWDTPACAFPPCAGVWTLESGIQWLKHLFFGLAPEVSWGVAARLTAVSIIGAWHHQRSPPLASGTAWSHCPPGYAGWLSLDQVLVNPAS